MPLNTKITKGIFFASLILAMSMLLSACRFDDASSNDSQREAGEKYRLKKVSTYEAENLASDSEVDRIVKEHIWAENVELVSQTSTGVRTNYTYKSLDRELYINVESCLYGEGGIPGGGVAYYRQYVNVHYADAVANYYWPRITKLLDEDGLNWKTEHGDSCIADIYYSSFAELKDISSTIAKIDDIVAEEANINSTEWLEDYRIQMPAIDVAYIGLNAYGLDDYNISRLLANGSNDEAQIYKELTKKHAKAIANHYIEDPTVSDAGLSVAHKDTLFDIYIDDVNVSEEAWTRQYDGRLKRQKYQSEDSRYSCLYDENLDTYMILLDVGPLYENNEKYPIIDVYLECLTEKHEVNIGEDESEISWTYAGSEWRVESVETSMQTNGYFSFDCEVYKDGAKQDIDLIYKKDTNARFSGMAMVCVGIAVDDFADLFDLTYEIDESDCGTITFHKNS